MDLAFEQMLAEHNQAFKDSEVYSNWMPDDGEYIASIVKFDSGQKEKDGTKTACINSLVALRMFRMRNLMARNFSLISTGRQLMVS